MYGNLTRYVSKVTQLVGTLKSTPILVCGSNFVLATRGPVIALFNFLPYTGNCDYGVMGWFYVMLLRLYATSRRQSHNSIHVIVYSMDLVFMVD